MTNAEELYKKEKDNMERIYHTGLNLMLEEIDKLDVKDNEKAMILLTIVETMKANIVHSIDVQLKEE